MLLTRESNTGISVFISGRAWWVNKRSFLSEQQNPLQALRGVCRRAPLVSPSALNLQRFTVYPRVFLPLRSVWRQAGLVVWFCFFRPRSNLVFCLRLLPFFPPSSPSLLPPPFSSRPQRVDENGAGEGTEPGQSLLAFCSPSSCASHAA